MRLSKLKIGDCFKMERDTGLKLFGNPILEIEYYIILSQTETMIEIQNAKGVVYDIPYEDIKVTQVSQENFLREEELGKWLK